MTDLSDAQWCFLDLLVRAKSKGVSRINRMEVMNSPALPDGAKVGLVWAALTMPKEFVTLHGQHCFEITDAGLRAFNAKFGKGEAAAKPTAIADEIIMLPDRSMETLQ